MNKIINRPIGFKSLHSAGKAGRANWVDIGFPIKFREEFDWTPFGEVPNNN
jgi:hypothetical protein